MTPITPDLHKQSIFKTQLPAKWMPAYEYLVRLSATKSEVASFPTIFLSAFNGNEDAVRKILELVYVSHYAARHYAKTQEEVSAANAVIFLGNQLAEHWQAQQQNAELEKLKATIKPEAKPETKPAAKAEPTKTARVEKPARVEKQAKPIDSKIQFTKPGTFRSEKKN